MRGMGAISKISSLVLVIGPIALIIAGSLTLSKSRANGNVDMLLLLAQDISASVDENEFLLMREGLAAALESPEVAHAIASGQNGAIGLAVVQWSGFSEQQVNIDWRRVATPADLTTVAGEVRRFGRRWDHGSTDIGGAIEFSKRKILSAPFTAPRMVIDVAGDGTNNTNQTPNLERDRAVKEGLIINGLAITGGSPALLNYYEMFVIGGPGAFAEATDDYPSFERAMRRKLVREINHMILF